MYSQQFNNRGYNTSKGNIAYIEELNNHIRINVNYEIINACRNKLSRINNYIFLNNNKYVEIFFKKCNIFLATISKLNKQKKINRREEWDSFYTK